MYNLKILTVIPYVWHDSQPGTPQSNYYNIKVISVKRVVLLLWKKKKSFDLRALNINYATSYQKHGYLQNHTDEESLKKDWTASLRSDFHLFSTNELLRNLHIYF